MQAISICLISKMTELTYTLSVSRLPYLNLRTDVLIQVVFLDDMGKTKTPEIVPGVPCFIRSEF